MARKKKEKVIPDPEAPVIETVVVETPVVEPVVEPVVVEETPVVDDSLAMAKKRRKRNMGF